MFVSLTQNGDISRSYIVYTSVFCSYLKSLWRKRAGGALRVFSCLSSDAMFVAQSSHRSDGRRAFLDAIQLIYSSQLLVRIYAARRNLLPVLFPHRTPQQPTLVYWSKAQLSLRTCFFLLNTIYWVEPLVLCRPWLKRFGTRKGKRKERLTCWLFLQQQFCTDMEEKQNACLPTAFFFFCPHY